MNTPMRNALVIAAIIIACTAKPIMAQAPTSLQGTWTTPPELVARAPLPEKGKVGAGAKGATALRLVVSGDTVRWTGLGVTYRYVLDGSETTNCARSNGQCYDDKCRAHRLADTLITSCRSTLGGRSSEIITTQRVWIDGDGNLQLGGRVTVSGVTAALHSTYIRQGVIVFDLGS